MTHTLPLGKIKFDIILLLMLFNLGFSCSESTNNEVENRIWYLKYQMKLFEYKGDLISAEKTLDTILSINPKINDIELFNTALKILLKNEKVDKSNFLKNTVSKELKNQICQDYFYPGSLYDDFCKGISSNIDFNNPKLKELIIMYFNDQNDRGNYEEELLHKYDLNKDSIIYTGNVDIINLEKLKIILKDSFPKKKEVGRDGMLAIFFVTQHCRDIEFQEFVLAYMEKNLLNDEFENSDYAYLFDRICFNKNIPQKFGTQVKYTNKKNGTVIFHPILDSLNVDSLRKNMGLSPISLYKELMLL